MIRYGARLTRHTWITMPIWLAIPVGLAVAVLALAAYTGAAIIWLTWHAVRLTAHGCQQATHAIRARHALAKHA